MGTIKMKKISISLLVPARANSKFLGHFLASYAAKTADKKNTQLILFLGELDAWNQDLIKVLDIENMMVMVDEIQAGQSGHHIYLNTMLPEATGDWIGHTCDDIPIIMDGWDDYLRNFIKEKHLSHEKIYQLIPGMHEPGANIHFLSRSYVDTVGKMAGYPNTDSWNNTVFDQIPFKIRNGRRIDVPGKLFRDYTRDGGFCGAMNYGLYARKRIKNPNWETKEMQDAVKIDGHKLLQAIKNGK